MSQFYPANFTIDCGSSGKIRFNCAEQWMMYSKSTLFPGNESITKKILASSTPSDIKALGRQVKGFTPGVWDKHRYQIVVAGNLAKFSQNPHLSKILTDTGKATLVEASPNDNIWGVGLHIDDPDIYHAEKWKGLNLLGKALMDVRDQLVAQV